MYAVHCCAFSSKCTFVCTRCQACLGVYALRGFLRHALSGTIMLGCVRFVRYAFVRLAFVRQALSGLLLSGLLLSGMLGCARFVHLVAYTSFIVLVHINSN